ncbi:hypothetical protein ASC94_11145 [Massilia sp. Root418]|uniref:DUF932 domain-containing protein n=1 Tax=Massilia sp. Root418 TaxID=1736532 RepID=UPI0006F8BBBF|nr:DUF932 domain-containing protein [Massilia sp. Root418]KQW93223.1 hypothetical protein ASC94_11145 [Massilia sp. Root418]
MKTGRSLMDLAAELERQAAAKRDLIVPAKKMRGETTAAGQFRLVIDEAGGEARYPLCDFVCGQLAKKLDIPLTYFKRMREYYPELLDQNVNGWLRINSPDSYLVRTLDGYARAFLSTRYRRLDNFDLAKSIVPVLQQLPGARFESVELTARKLYIKVVSSKIQCEVAPGDVVQAGVIVSNSEIGCGTLRVEPLLFRLVCSNGLIMADRAMRKNHAGRNLVSDDDEVLVYQDDTLEADDKAIFLKVRDLVQTAVSDVTFELISEKMRKTMGIKLVGNPVKAVELLANRYALNEAECAGVLRHLFGERELTGYSLVNAVTGYSQEVDDYDRATEFEELGGKLLALSAAEWRPIAEAA